MPIKFLADEGLPVFLDEPQPPRPSANRAPLRPDVVGVGLEGVRSYRVQHPKMGVVKVSAHNYDAAVHGPIIATYEADGSEILDSDGQPRTTPLP